MQKSCNNEQEVESLSDLDYVVLFFYLIGLFVVGAICTRRIKNTKDMFAAGGQSPWWVSGLSSFMTMFSAGTFVVWGGIAYKYGIVAVSINMCYGIAALLVGYFLAGRWHDMGIATPAEYIELRFGKSAIHFYTWSMMTYRLVGVGVSLYSLAVLLCALIPLSPHHMLADPATGNLALKWAVLLFGGVVVIYTMAGGLWAVLMTDVLQFIVLNLAVLFVVPLCLAKVGGWTEFVTTVPEGFFCATHSQFTWFFLAGWCAIHFFMLGAEWAFVQRHICVPSAKDARKAAYLFGGLYIVSPWLWLLPPLLYRSMNPNANHEEAYILACKAVLPPGMLGLMMAAMFSATASMVSSQLNVFAGVLTHDFYFRWLRPQASTGHLVRVGRVLTVVLGGGLIAIAWAVPHMGGAQEVILSITGLMVTPLLLPSVWGLFSRRIKQNCIWPTAGISLAIGALIKFGFAPHGFLTNGSGWASVTAWIQAHIRTVETSVGVLLPVLVLWIIHVNTRGVSAGYQRVAAKTRETDDVVLQTSPLPAVIVAWSLAACAVLMFSLAWAQPLGVSKTMLTFAMILLMISGAIALGIRLRKKN